MSLGGVSDTRMLSLRKGGWIAEWFGEHQPCHHEVLLVSPGSLPGQRYGRGNLRDCSV